jgi:hypothetical protein
MAELVEYRRALRVRSQADLLKRLADMGIEPKPSTGPPVAAYVNHGRLVADCYECGSGIACGMDEPKAVCCQCGTIHHVTRPNRATLNAVLRVLEARPRSAWNWTPGAETRDDLAADNWRHARPVIENDPDAPDPREIQRRARGEE